MYTKVKDVYAKGRGCRHAVASCFPRGGLGSIGEGLYEEK